MEHRRDNTKGTDSSTKQSKTEDPRSPYSTAGYDKKSYIDRKLHESIYDEQYKKIIDEQNRRHQQELRAKVNTDYDNPETPRLRGGMDHLTTIEESHLRSAFSHIVRERGGEQNLTSKGKKDIARLINTYNDGESALNTLREWQNSPNIDKKDFANKALENAYASQFSQDSDGDSPSPPRAR